MDRLEERLRSAFADDRLDLPLRPDAPSRVRAGVRRRRRNRAIATVASAVILLGGGLAAASLVPGTSSDERVVPPTGGSRPASTKPTPPAPSVVNEISWAAAPYDYHHPPAFPGAVADPTVAWCRASQLSVSQFFQGAGGSWVGTVSVTNTSTATCAVQGQPAVTMQTASGHALVTSRPEPFFVDAWVRLAPGNSASATITWWPDFCREPAVGRISIALPHSGGSLATRMHGNPRCDLDTGVARPGRLDVDGFLASQQTPFTPLAGLAAQLEQVPASAQPGTVLTYRLRLQSSHSPSVPLDPCLPYRERLVNHATGIVLFEQDFLLNCGTPPVGIGDARFDLRLDVPASAPTGDYDLTWQSVLKPVNAIAENVVRVLPAVAPCRDGQLTASDSPRRGWQAMNQYGHAIVLRNVSSTPCSLRGYPGVTLVDSAGHQIGKAASRGDGFVYPDPGPHTIVLAALTGTASFTFGGLAITGDGLTPCPVSAAAVIYPPGLLHELRVSLHEPYCAGGITVTAVVPGSRGAHY